MLIRADVRFDGDRPWDVQVRNESLFDRVLAYGNLGAGEAYTDGWWDCDSLDDMVCRIWQSDLPAYMQQLRGWPSMLTDVLINRQRGCRAFKVGKQHYDLGNVLYECMLDKRMIYSCGYWKDATNLDQAQEKTRSDCPQASTRAGHDRSGYRLWMGWVNSLSARALRHIRPWNYRVRGAGQTGPGKLFLR